jgi:hypothetical protein
MITSSISSAAKPDFNKAALMAIAPKAVADKVLKEPPKEPMGVLTAETIYTSLFIG